ncbi:SAM-dependent methyltransferase [Frankia nepalensis]|uniref:SAM-dependent methyltransferase n=1 Tax=Frankia nepalensis TaxID=1836974 RepID=UPI0027DDFDD1|nr:SAM-dependent methyltransferase [Frankia nepalensis]
MGNPDTWTADEADFPAWQESAAGRVTPVELKTDVAHSARMYDYFLGGKDNFPADRAAAQQALAVFPEIPLAARINRAFLHNATRYAVESGIRQFLDVGTGIPTRPNLHEIAQGIAPESRVVYVDNDPIVLAHARALLTSSPRGRTAYVDEDLRDPGRILASEDLRETLDLTRPVALSLIAVLHFLSKDEQREVVGELVAAVPSGSTLALTHGTSDYDPEHAERLAAVYRAQGINITTRTRAQVEELLDGLDLIGPGVREIHLWTADGSPVEFTAEAAAAGRAIYAAVGRKP